MNAVQPPTREQIAETIDAWWEGTDPDGVMAEDVEALKADLLAMLSQPTPSAESEESGVCHCGTDMDAHTWVDGHSPVDMGFPPAEPVSIPDMAPGTRFVGRVRDGALSTVDLTWMVADGHHVFSTGAHLLAADRIDPSTIRDITPPTVTLEDGQ